MKRLAFVLLPALLGSGCHLYFGDDDCDDYGGARALVVELRNPYSGQCEAGGGGGGGGGGCDPAYEDEAQPEPVDWAACWGYCEGLDEQSCLATSECRAAYASSCLEWESCSEQVYTFYGCWGTAPSGAIQGGGCEGLDAYQCSRHDDCVARHYAGSSCGGGGTEGGGADCAPIADPALIGNFQACAAEPNQEQGCYEDWECPSGQTCNAEEVCLPGPYSCSGSGGGGGTGESDAFVPCDNRCYGWCVPGTTDPGNCYEPAYCDSLPPTCPDGTIPGVSNGCWTGYCIPAAECPDQPPACEEIFTENACIAAGECTPVYEGVNCTCDPNGCVCEDWIFVSCSSGATDSP